MIDSKSKILLIVEGSKTDYQLMERLINEYEINTSHEIVSYNTNIYVLYNEMFKDQDPDTLDLLQVLRSREKDEEKKKLFDQHFSDILLVFDLDPQDPNFSEDKIIKMASYFTESTNMGKLYLNYPMVEAFYHMKSIPDSDYYNYYATMDELKKRLYKSRVNAESKNRDPRKFAVNRTEYNTIINQNIKKAFSIIKLLGSKKAVSSGLPDTFDILLAQMGILSAEAKVSVLCTCVFFIPEYNPNFLND